jgi:hypothetical protein
MNFGANAMKTRIVSSALVLRVVPLVRPRNRLASLGLVIAMVIGNGGPPNVLRQPASVELEFAAMALMLLGLLIGWVHEAFGGVLVILGLAAFNVVELVVNGRPSTGAFPLFAVPGILFLLKPCRMAARLPHLWIHHERSASVQNQASVGRILNMDRRLGVAYDLFSVGAGGWKCAESVR